MKQCLFLILLMITPGLALATDFNALIDQGMQKQQSIHSRVSSSVGSEHGTTSPMMKTGSVKSQPLVIKFKLKRSVANSHSKKSKTKLAAKPAVHTKQRSVATSAKGRKISIAKHDVKKKTKIAQVKKDKQTKIAKSKPNKPARQKIAANI